eukprot:m.142121 g.142121  ORF g.142121 m.142121 type:complete len:166 (+) comp24171_c0_seq2:919-1416(+)
MVRKMPLSTGFGILPALASLLVPVCHYIVAGIYSLCRRLVSPHTLSVQYVQSTHMLVFAHCSLAHQGAVVLMVVNLNTQASPLTLDSTVAATPRDEYILSASSLHDFSLRLNGVELDSHLSNGTLPKLPPHHVPAGSEGQENTILLPALSQSYLELLTPVSSCMS